jgi:hypothetical protein
MARRKSTRPAGYPATPEHDKLREAMEYSQKIGEFLDWLEDKKIMLAEEREWHEDDVLAQTLSALDPRAKYLDKKQRKVNGLLPIRQGKEELLAEFFGIDRWKLEDEKRALLDYQRELDAAAAQ